MQCGCQGQGVVALKSGKSGKGFICLFTVISDNCESLYMFQLDNNLVFFQK